MFKQAHTKKFALNQACQVNSFIKNYDNFIFDCDGVLWAADNLLPKVKETIEYLQSMNKKVIFVTNNSTKSRVKYYEKFMKLGLKNISIDSIYSATYAVAKFLALNHPNVKKAFIIGSQGFRDELANVGIETLGSEIIHEIKNEEDFIRLEVDPLIGAVILGSDFSFDYSKLAYASLCLQKIPDCVFVATDRDAYDQLLDRKLPCMTAMIAGLESSTGISPTVLGKPSKWLADLVVSEHSLDVEKTCMVGDRLDSDMQFGKNAHVTTLLVMTGCTTHGELDRVKDSSFRCPDYITSHVGKIFESKEELNSDS